MPSAAVASCRAVRQIEGETDSPVCFQPFAGLNCEAVFAQVEHLAQVKHHSGVRTTETSVHRSMELVTNAASTLADATSGGWILQPDNAQFHGSDPWPKTHTY